jgi:ribose transport system permease protein
VTTVNPPIDDQLTDELMRPPLMGAWSATRPFRPVLVLLVALFVVLSLSQGIFLTGGNLEDMLTSVAVLWIVAMGMTFVLLSGGFDLSVGATAAFTGYFIARALNGGIDGWLAVVLAIAVGAAIGAFVNGLLVGRFGLSVFVVTLASMTGLTGVVNLWSNTQSIYVTSPVIEKLAINNLAGVPTPIWIMILTFLIALWVQRSTYFGRDVYAVGGSATAARLSGIRVERTLMLVYAIVGGCAALSSVIAVGQVGAASPQVDPNLPLQAIAAVLLGGTVLGGGAGGVGGTALGVLFIGVLQNGLSLAGVASFWQQILTGVILVAAVLGGRIGDVRTLSVSLRSRRSTT